MVEYKHERHSNTKNFRQTYQIQGRQRLEEIPHIKELNSASAKIEASELAELGSSCAVKSIIHTIWYFNS